MRAFSIVLVSLVGIATNAAAQTGPQMSCNGMLMMSMGLSVKNSDGTFTSLAQGATGNVIDQAECLCANNNAQAGPLYVTGLITAALPSTPVEGYEVWVGSGCDMTRTNSSVVNPCEQVMGTAQTTAYQNYVSGGSQPQQFIPVQALVSPKQHVCTGAPSNALYFLFLKSSTMIDNSCSITLPAQMMGPDQPSGVSAGSGDGAVVLSWNPPSVSSNKPFLYQVLCSDADGNPASLGNFPLHYSTCTTGGLQRQVISTSGGIGTGTDDGGVATDDAGTSSLPLGTSSIQPDSDPVDGGTDDGAVDGGAADLAGENVDMATVPLFTVGPAPFTNLDKKFLCTDRIDPSQTQVRIDGLANGKVYQFTVVAIDAFGNPVASDVVKATPLAAEDLYRRFRDEGGKPQGFCFVATAAYGSYESPFVQVLRDFRDRELLPHALGRRFVDFYYRASPPLAHFIADHSLARFAAREALWPAIVGAALWMGLGALGRVAIVALLLALWTYRRNLRRRMA